MIPQLLAKSVRLSRASAWIRASADRGWMSEKHPLLAAEGKRFYLTSPFIEPDGLEHFAEALSELDFCPALAILLHLPFACARSENAISASTKEHSEVCLRFLNHGQANPC